MDDATAEELAALEYVRASIEAAIHKPLNEPRDAVWPFVVSVPISRDGYLDVSNAVVLAGSPEQDSAFRQIGASLQTALRCAQRSTG